MIVKLKRAKSYNKDTTLMCPHCYNEIIFYNEEDLKKKKSNDIITSDIFLDELGDEMDNGEAMICGNCKWSYGNELREEWKRLQIVKEWDE